MGCSQNYGPLFVIVIDCTTAPNIQGYQNGTLILGTTQIRRERIVYVQPFLLCKLSSLPQAEHANQATNLRRLCAVVEVVQDLVSA